MPVSAITAASSGALQRDEPGLHAAAVRHFGSYDGALRAARLDPDKLRQRRSWTRQIVKDELKEIFKEGHPLSDSTLRRDHPALYGAAVRLSELSRRRAAAGVKVKK